MPKYSIKNVRRLATDQGLPGSKHSFGSLIQKINRKLNSGMYDGQLLNFVFDSLEHLIPFDRIGIALVDEYYENISLKWAKAKNTPIALKEGFSMPLKDTSLLPILETGRPRIINDLLAYGNEHPQSTATRLAIQDGIRSSFTCPLRRGNKYSGIVFFSSFETNTYDGSHVDTFLDIAEELSILVEHERLQTYAAMSKKNETTLAALLHDLRSPVSTMSSYIEFSKQEDWFPYLPVEAKRAFDVLSRHTKFVFNLLDDLRELLRIEGRPISLLRKRQVDLASYVNELKCMSFILTKQKDMVLDFQANGLPQCATFDPEKIRRALDNLVSNAVKYSNRHSLIRVIIEKHNGNLRFCVIDQGQGIPEGELNKLFHDFGRTSVLPTEGEPSSGLGLAIVRRIAEQHGGTVGVESTVGEGSEFFFSIPV